MDGQFHPLIIERNAFSRLIDTLKNEGYFVVGPTVRDGAIAYGQLGSDADLPVGWTDEQDGGLYRLRRRDDGALFGYVVGPQSWKQFLFPPRSRLCTVELTQDGMRIEPEDPGATRYAFVGVRACELAAIQIQDRVFVEGSYVDPAYTSRRAGAFVLAVNCGEAGNTCFCASMGTGPSVGTGHDLALTELLDSDSHRFLVEIGSERGRAIVEQLPTRPASAEEIEYARERVAGAGKQMGRSLETDGIKDLLYDNLEHPQWDDVAARCLTCANCTLVCPTCFCSTTRDVSDLSGNHAERWREWDSCFTQEFSYLHGGSVRVSAKSRYRQWLTHKMASWIDQFGSSGCVGCGRCITWCPVGIDLTEEIREIRRGVAEAGVAAQEGAAS